MVRVAKNWGCVAALLAAPLAHATTPVAVEVAPESTADRQRALTCLTLAIAYEAGWEPLEGQQAVAEVVLNRMRAPAYPKSVCGVVFAGHQRRTGCQFTFTCDGSLARRLSGTVMVRARMVAQNALDGLNPARAPGATHYHADYVSPYWAPSLARVATIGRHIFYRPPGARDQQLAGSPIVRFAEPLIDKMQPFQAEGTGGEPGGMLPAVQRAGQTDARQTGAFLPWGLPVAAPAR